MIKLKHKFIQILPLSDIHLPQFVENTKFDPSRAVFPEDFPDTIVVDTIHTGNFIPEEFYYDNNNNPLFNDKELEKYFINEKDWGAELVASNLVEILNLKGYYTIPIARVLMDFGRFPGKTEEDANHYSRLAINRLFSDKLSKEQTRKLLSDCYRTTSQKLGNLLQNKLLKIAIHTYDKHNPSGTIRPEVALLTRPETYQREACMSPGIFDDMFPATLAEFTASRRFTYFLALILERAGIHVDINFPYTLPDGSVELRCQVWSFLNYVRLKFEQERPQVIEDLQYQHFWDLVLDNVLFWKHINDDVSLNSDLSLPIYNEVKSFCHNEDLINEYKYSSSRLSSIAIEIRKDLVWDFHNGMPVGPKEEQAQDIANILASGVREYLKEIVDG